MSRPIIAILRGLRPEEAEDHAAALIAAGITTLEVPLNSPEAFSSVERLLRRFKTRAKIGAGTVLEVAEVERLAALGADLVVSPNCDPEVIRATIGAGMESWPGVLTPTEAFTALKAGATGLKLFPGFLLGPQGLAALKAVLPTTARLYAVGGAGPENFRDWLKAGAHGFGVGTALYRPSQSPQETEKAAQRLVAAYDAALEALS